MHESRCVWVLYSQFFLFFRSLSYQQWPWESSLLFRFTHTKAKKSFQLKHWNSRNISCKCTSVVSDLLFFLPVCRPWSSAGQSVRTRRILQEAHEEGRPCPNQLLQTKPCPIRPCYTWLLSDWSPCTVEVSPALWMLDLICHFPSPGVFMYLQRGPLALAQLSTQSSWFLVFLTIIFSMHSIFLFNRGSLEWHCSELPHFLKVPRGVFHY